MASSSNNAASTSVVRGACMECRRLKTKCDRAVPCAPCVRRGCESICPSGLRARGSRNPSAEVEQLNRNIQGMTARIRQLEEALSNAQAHASSSNSGGSPSPPPVSHLMLDYGQAEFSAVTRRRSYSDELVQGQRRQHILNMLPGENTAWELVERFYTNYGWLIQPFSRDYLVNTLLKRSYTMPCTASNSEISALCSVFSLAAASDVQPAGPWLKAEQFHELSMAALQLDDILNEPSLVAVEAMALQSTYLYLVADSSNAQRAWNYLGIAIRMAVGIGLHRDPALLGLDDEECIRRRRLFYEIISLDAWQSMVIQKPPSFQETLFSTEMPFDTPESLGSDPTFFRWKHTFHREVVVPIIKEVTCATSTPDYGTILKVDQLIRSIKFPPTLQYVDFKTAPVELLLQSQQIFLMREITMIKLHKGYFFRALDEHPEDPFQGFAVSVTAMIESATALLKRLRVISTDCARLIPRLNCPWEAAVASLSYLAMFIRKVPNGATLKQVYIEFEMGCKVVSDHAEDTIRIKRLMPHVIEIRRLVHDSVPHLTQELRRALSERRRVGNSSPPTGVNLSLEYPLGPGPKGMMVSGPNTFDTSFSGFGPSFAPQTYDTQPADVFSSVPSALGTFIGENVQDFGLYGPTGTVFEPVPEVAGTYALSLDHSSGSSVDERSMVRGSPYPPGPEVSDLQDGRGPEFVATGHYPLLY